VVYNIIEVANTHNGDEGYLNNLIDSFSDFGKGFGMKFQPSKPDCIATPDYEYFHVYNGFFFTEEKWASFIDKTFKTKDVWLDLFDTYSIKILKKNINKIVGIKLQASVLNNLEVIQALSKIDLSTKKLIINISGYKLDQIDFLIERFNDNLKPGELLIEIGFQAYPTKLIDSGFSKIKKITERFTNGIVFAEHLDANDTSSIYLPIMAAMQGVSIIEKHVRLDRETKYDHFSSLTPDKYREYINRLHEFLSLNNQPFINDSEIDYLKNSLMKPQLSRDKPKGSLLDINNDLIFRRSGRNGLDMFDLTELIQSQNLFSKDCEPGQTLSRHNFKKAHIATIVACRLKSIRLKSKALEKIGNLTSIEYCIKNCLRFPYTSSTVLATSNLENDSELSNYIYSNSVHFFEGDPDDVIKRYADVLDHLKVDVFVRVTGDNPFVDAGICQFLIEKHFESGADYTTAKKTAIGVNLEIINSNALYKVRRYFSDAPYSEYMSRYFTNNPEYFKINIVDLPPEYVRDYRLTLDYPEDLILFNEIHANLFPDKPDFNVLDIFELLDTTNLSSLNGHINQKYQTDKQLIELLDEKTRIKQHQLS
jgi:N,N'-diacetyllegionaminate synthase